MHWANFLHRHNQENPFHFFVNFWERLILRVYNESFAQVPNFGSHFLTIARGIILIYQ